MGANGSKITPQDRAILDLKVQRDRLKQYSKKIQIVALREKEIAKEALLTGNKRKALLALKKKKYQEALLEKTETQLINLEELTQSIEFALVEKEVLAGLARGNEILKEIHNEISLEQVEQLMEDTADAIAYQNEIEELLSGKITDEDEEEIMQELEAIVEEQIASEINASMPKVPDVELPASTKVHKKPQKEEEQQMLPA
ncbi:6356_t:CDS:2 [Paraglomus occultum]|uniref:6356_t:CDS:1 n=1 Tax=Paraglomus occultum TaxID=144539 RepID=A0A9N9CSL6_9GLOM|nr:6356_t:CDS:2 [Paraglomus occultum]